MTSRDFCYWLRGYIQSPTGEQAIPPAIAEKIRKKMTEIVQYDYVPYVWPNYSNSYAFNGNAIGDQAYGTGTSVSPNVSMQMLAANQEFFGTGTR